MKRNDRIRQIAVYAAFIILLPALQVSFPGVLSFRGQTADFMLILVVLSGYFYGTTDGAVVGLSVGFIRDVLAGSTLGVGALIFFFVGILSSMVFSKAFHSRATLAILQVALVTGIYKVLGHGISFFIPFLLHHDSSYLPLHYVLFDSVLPQLAINFAATLPMILFIRYLGPYRIGYVKPSAEEMVSSEAIWRKG